MIPDLSGVVEHSSCWSFLYDIFERESLIFCTGDELIEIIYIGLMMLPVVIFEGLLRDVRSECIE
jgi:hypothetical protein